MDVICFSDITWNFLWQRQQHIITRLPDDWNIVFVEPSLWLSLAWKLIRGEGGEGKGSSGGGSGRAFGPRRARDNILVASVATIPGGDRFGPTRRINDRLIRWGIGRLARKSGMKDPVLLFYKPRYSCAAEGFADPVVCYDITDDTMALGASPGWLEERVRLLEEKADLLTTSSETIFGRISRGGEGRTGRKIFHVGNGVDPAHFVGGGKGGGGGDGRRSGSVIGYTGAIGEWFDFELLERMLAEFPDAQTVLVGWVFRDQRRALGRLESRYGNLRVTGPKRYGELPGIVGGFDVCVIPFRIYRLTESVNPVKVYEYFAAGRPVVTTALPELKKYSDALYYSEGRDQFLENVRTALTVPYDPQRPLQIARDNDWDSKAAEMARLITRQCGKGDRARSRNG